jgi:hypothetical protein
MRPSRLLVVCLLLLAAAIPAAAGAAERMYVGFQDDPSFRWRADRMEMLTQAADANATILRTTVYWSKVAPRRPANAKSPFEPSYRFDDIDELVRTAEREGMTVMLTIWGTPNWANGGKGQNRAPTRMIDLQNFGQALASRYSGRFPGLPFVGHFSVWNEPNLEQFLAPTFDAQGRPASPFTYAKMFQAAYTGIKAGNSRALVAIGETSPRGRDKLTPAPGKLQNTLSPGNFAKLVSQANPALKFDAWAHHPYSTLGASPNQAVRFPNVNLTQLPTFEKNLDTWFKRKNIPIWITEYAFETKPAEPKGVTVAQQAAYAAQVLRKVRLDPRVQMFIWFIFRDDPTSTWQSGLLTQAGAKKPSFATFSAGAKLADVRSPLVSIKAGSTAPIVRVPVWELAARDGVGTKIGATVRTHRGTHLVGVAQPASIIDIDGWAAFPVPFVNPAEKGQRYDIEFEINDANGNKLLRTATLVAS